MKDINFSRIEKKWQKKWEEADVFKARDGKGKKCYVLEMFPYPSSAGLHLGHALNYVIGDIYARYKKMQGFNVLHPMGFDSFGLPAENAAIKAKSHPKKFTEEAIKNYIKQLKGLGISYDWERMVETHKPEYYKWDQWIFLKMFERGLAYKKKSPVNWCRKCGTVLANEQVQNGKCWRHEDTDVEVKNLEQWFLKTTEYADELYTGIDKLEEWPEVIKTLQKNWIAKSEGVEIKFDINGEAWKVFTTRADTLMGVTFLVISAQHPRLMDLVTEKQKKEVEKFVKKIKSTKQEDLDKLEKEGVFIGAYAKHPVTGEQVPVWVGNFVLADYGSGMVMAVPAHDSRDFDFAKKYGIPIKRVIKPKKNKVITIEKSLNNEFYTKAKKYGELKLVDGLVYVYTDKVDEIFELAKDSFVGGPWYIHSEGNISKILFHSKNGENQIFDWSDESGINEAKNYGKTIKIKEEQLDFNEVREAFTDYGILVNSEPFSGLQSDEAIEHIAGYLKTKKLGGKTTNFKLRDWLISRQRFWGTPIPIIYCDKCGIVPVPEKDLPVELPDGIKFEGKGNPLEGHKKFTETKCPKCGGKGRREIDTMDTFVNSSWYYLRYCDSKNEKKMFDKSKAEYWCPVDLYIGGKEHACLHLIYTRFYTKFLRDLGLLDFDEPAVRLFNQGFLLGEDGEKMSKSKGNVILPEVVSDKYGLDAARFFLVSVASPDKDKSWSDNGADGSARFVKRIFEYTENVKVGKSSERVEHYLNKTIKGIEQDIEYLGYNYATIKLRALFEVLVSEEVSKKDIEKFIKLLSPFMPHIAEEIWEKLGGKGFIASSEWPKFDEKKINDKFDEAEKAVEKTVSDVLNVLKIVKEKQGKEVEKVHVYVLPNEFENYNSEELSKRVGKSVKVWKVNDKEKYDPEGKAGKAKPGKPGIYVE